MTVSCACNMVASMQSHCNGDVTYSYRIYLLCPNVFGAGSVFYIGNFEVGVAEMIAFYKRYAAIMALLFCVCFVSERR